MRLCIAAGLLALFPATALADCDVEITVNNTSDWTVTVPLDRMRARSRVGTWRRMFPDEDDVELAAGDSWTGDFSMRSCAWNQFHKFEFAIEREPNCVFQGETITAHVWQGSGIGSNRQDRDAGLIVQQWPEDGFVRNDHLDADPGRPPYRRNSLSVTFNQVGNMCRAARGE